MKRIKQVLVALALVVGVGVLAAPVTVGAITPYEACTGVADTDSAVCKSKGEKVDTLLTTVINTLLYLVGAVSVIMIIIGGFKYTISNGDSGALKSAKDTILYAVIGLVVAFLAFAIVNWVVAGLIDGPAIAECEKNGGTFDSSTKVCN